MGESEAGLNLGANGCILPLACHWAPISRIYNLSWSWGAELRPLLYHPKTPSTGARQLPVASTMALTAMLQIATFRLNLTKSFWGTTQEHVERPHLALLVYGCMFTWFTERAKNRP